MKTLGRAWLCLAVSIATLRAGEVMTVTGRVPADEMGVTLSHEHLLVDFIGADKITPERWDREAVIARVLPFLEEAKAAGCETLVDCTPNYLGRDAVLLERLSALSGVRILTNTGFYGGSDEKFLPKSAFDETDRQLADRWIDEWREGIDGTRVRPGFIKISVNGGPLSEVSRKLIRAAALTHLETGLTIASHTGPTEPALEQIAILEAMGVSPAAFIWVHAQHDRDAEAWANAARRGAWVSLDGLNEDNVAEYVAMLAAMKRAGCLHRVLVSHDAGWYRPGEPGGGEFRGFTTLFEKLLPALRAEQFSDDEIALLMRRNPAEAFTIGVRGLPD